MTKVTTLEELVKKYLKDSPTPSSPATYEGYLHENGLSHANKYSSSASSLYALSKRSGADFGSNKRNLANSGLQNSGYAEYIDALSRSKLESGLKSLENEYKESDQKARSSYTSYLDSYRRKEQTLKNSVMSHLISNDIADLGTAIAYGMSAGLSKEAATLVGYGAYEITKQKVLNKLLEQTASLGLDKDGAELLAKRMGVSESDAKDMADEVYDILKYYGNLSEDYLEFLEQRAN